MIRPQRLEGIRHDTKRDYYKTYTYGSLALPKQGLGRKPLSIKDQGDSLYCTAYTISEAIENQTGILMSPEYQVAKEGQIAGAPIFSGIDPLVALKSGRVYGALPQVQSPYTFSKDGWQKPALWQNYVPEFDTFASSFKRPSFYSVTAGNPQDMDTYSAIQLALWDAREDKAPIMAFGYWYDEWQHIGPDGVLPMPTKRPVSRHAYTLLDWCERGAVVLSHQGKGYGDGGIAYMPENVVNEVFFNLKENALGLYIYRSTAAPYFQVFTSWLHKFV